MVSLLSRETTTPEHANIEDFVMMENGGSDKMIPIDTIPEILCRSDLIDIAMKSISRYQKICANDELPSEHVIRAIVALSDAIKALKDMLAIDYVTEEEAEHLKQPRHMYITKDRRLAWAIP